MKNIKTAIVVLFIGLTTAVVGSILMGINSMGPGASFNIIPLATMLKDIGFIAAALAGVVITGFCVVTAVQGETPSKDKK